jgi:hypothetical protein
VVFDHAGAALRLGEFSQPGCEQLLASAVVALVLNQAHELVLRGGGGVYYYRTRSGPLTDLARYQYAKLRLLQISANQQPLSVSSFKVLNHVNGSYVDTTEAVQILPR